MQEGAKTQICSGAALNLVWVSEQSRCAEAKEGDQLGTIINNN